ncbi:hypothetical protein B0H13DRAFT_2338002 [Mycena leptocephala]|nr:hypothetical protein B0H13DRAFT_2338002 [Mycena leptocephala]
MTPSSFLPSGHICTMPGFDWFKCIATLSTFNGFQLLVLTFFFSSDLSFL